MLYYLIHSQKFKIYLLSETCIAISQQLHVTFNSRDGKSP
jgi:hypothetical protein